MTEEVPTYRRDGGAPGGGVYHVRDPRRAPRPGDWLACGDTLVRVDQVVLGCVYVAAFRVGAQQPHAVVAVTIEEWSEATRKAGVVVMPDDDPRQTATILEAR